MTFAIDGFAICRGVLTPDATSALRNLVKRAFTEFDLGRLPEQSDTERALWRAYHEWDGLPLDLLSRILTLTEVHDILGRVGQRVGDSTGKFTWQPLSEISFFRRCQKPTSIVPWHCDAEAASTARYAQCVNAWVPLNQVGDGICPTLELIAGSHVFMRSYKGDTPVQLHRPEAWVAGVHGERVKPQLDLGDMLVFDHYLLHRTEVLDQYPVPRASVELRFAA